jgi:leucine-rich repeat protein SHOC2
MNRSIKNIILTICAIPCLAQAMQVNDAQLQERSAYSDHDYHNQVHAFYAGLTTGRPLTNFGQQLMQRRAQRIVQWFSEVQQPSTAATGLLDMPQDVLDQLAWYLSAKHKDVAHWRGTCHLLNEPAAQKESLLAETLPLQTNPLVAYLSNSSLVLLRQCCRRLRYLNDPIRLITIKGFPKLDSFIAWAQLTKAANPVSLDLGWNNLTALPPQIQQLKNLKRIDLNGNPLSQEAIALLCTSCPQLEEIYLYDNNLTALPPQIELLKNLKKINLSVNPLSQDAIALLCKACPRLEEIDFRYNELTALPAQMELLKNLKKISLNFNRLSQEAIALLCHACPQLEEIDFSYNELTALPPQIEQLKNLKNINLTGNNLPQNAIAQLCVSCPQLEEIDLSYNDLTALPPQIELLKKLKKLDLRGNNLSQEALALLCTVCPQLEEIILCNNNLTALPPQIELLKNLKKLKLNNNYLSPEAIAQLRQALPQTKIKDLL